MAVEDIGPVLGLWSRCPGIGLNDADTPEKIAAYLQRNPGLSFVAEIGNELTGAVLCGHDGRRGYLNHLAVLPTHRRRGLGRALVERCIDALGRAGLEKCHLFVFPENHDAMAFWRQSGWVHRTDLCLHSRLTDRSDPAANPTGP